MGTVIIAGRNHIFCIKKEKARDQSRMCHGNEELSSADLLISPGGYQLLGVFKTFIVVKFVILNSQR
jgi:hypothetical protein